MNFIFRFVLLLVIITTIISCKRPRHRDAIDETYAEENQEERSFRDEYREERALRNGTRVKMTQEGGVYTVPIIVNGLSLKFIFDTGASSICLSQAEALVMVRQGKITEDDVLGQEQFMDATGGVSVGTIVRLHTIEIGGLTLHDVEANVVDNISAPLLLGQTALTKFGKISIDYNEGYIEFN